MLHKPANAWITESRLVAKGRMPEGEETRQLWEGVEKKWPLSVKRNKSFEAVISKNNGLTDSEQGVPKPHVGHGSSVKKSLCQVKYLIRDNPMPDETDTGIMSYLTKPIIG